jgi:hypothetical protein
VRRAAQRAGKHQGSVLADSAAAGRATASSGQAAVAGRGHGQTKDSSGGGVVARRGSLVRRAAQRAGKHHRSFLADSAAAGRAIASGGHAAAAGRVRRATGQAVRLGLFPVAVFTGRRSAPGYVVTLLLFPKYYTSFLHFL